MSIDKILDKAASDIVTPAAKSSGMLIQDIIDSVRYKFTKSMQINAINQRVLDRVKNAVDEVPTENFTTINNAVLIPLLETLSLRDPGEMVSEAAINLISTASNKDTSNKVHPVFALKLREMADDELKLMSLFSQERARLAKELKETLNRHPEPLCLFDNLGNAVDYNETKAIYKTKKRVTENDIVFGHDTWATFEALMDISSLDSPEQVEVYIAHLESQGFIKIVHHSNTDTLGFLSYDIPSKINYEKDGISIFNHRPQIVTLSPLGKLLLECVNMDDRSQHSSGNIELYPAE